MPDLLAGNGFYGLMAAGNFDLLSGAADCGSRFENVYDLAIVVCGKQPSWLPLGIARQSGFFWKADWGEGTAGAEVFVVGDWRALGGLFERSGFFDGCANVGAGRVVEGDANHHVVGVVANSAFWNGEAFGGFEETGVGEDLQAIAFPGLGLLAIVPATAATFVLVGDCVSVAGAEGVYSASQA